MYVRFQRYLEYVTGFWLENKLVKLCKNRFRFGYSSHIFSADFTYSMHKTRYVFPIPMKFGIWYKNKFDKLYSNTLRFDYSSHIYTQPISHIWCTQSERDKIWHQKKLPNYIEISWGLGIANIYISAYFIHTECVAEFGYNNKCDKLIGN